VNGAPHRLGQVVLNLLMNAAQALPEGRADAHEIAVRAGARDGRAWIEVADDGPGVPPELRQRIFDPFFTTKPPGVGTGLGLSICHGIVTAAGGTLALEPSERGALFRIELPVADHAAPAGDPAPARAPKARVLVVDDEPQVAAALERLLSPPHDVVYAGDARAALAALERDAAYDVVLCDVTMPEMSGPDLHRELARRLPRLAARLAFMTGDAFSPRALALLDGCANERLDKPFDVAALRALVSRIAAGA
jgi:CheY-like chemotaxis protein